MNAGRAWLRTPARALFALFALFALSLIPLIATAIDTTRMEDPALQARYDALTRELRCMQCQNQSIADSPVGLASDLRREVRDLLVAGQSDAQIRDFMVGRYGDFILFRPRFSARGAWLWLLPGVLLLAGLLVAIRIVRQRSAMLPADDEAGTDTDADTGGRPLR